jgi:GNAT superfamily N-acetyltransferase
MLAAWPPLEREPLGDWTMRFARGFTRRANSVLPAGDPGVALEQAVETCEAAYRARGLSPSFQLRDGHVADGLEELLRGRGYALEHPALVLAGPLPRSLPDARVTHDDRPSDGWLETWVAFAPRSDPAAVERARGIVERIARPCTFALLHEEGRPIATALGTLSAGWLGVSCLSVREDARRRGVARAMLGSLAAWALDRGADGLWLEVEADNAPALTLYDDLGLERVGGYCYRTAASIIRTTP